MNYSAIRSVRVIDAATRLREQQQQQLLLLRSSLGTLFPVVKVMVSQGCPSHLL